jgi:hypothetical protein
MSAQRGRSISTEPSAAAAAAAAAAGLQPAPPSAGGPPHRETLATVIARLTAMAGRLQEDVAEQLARRRHLRSHALAAHMAVLQSEGLVAASAAAAAARTRRREGGGRPPGDAAPAVPVAAAAPSAAPAAAHQQAGGQPTTPGPFGDPTGALFGLDDAFAAADTRLSAAWQEQLSDLKRQLSGSSTATNDSGRFLLQGGGGSGGSGAFAATSGRLDSSGGGAAAAATEPPGVVRVGSDLDYRAAAAARVSTSFTYASGVAALPAAGQLPPPTCGLLDEGSPVTLGWRPAAAATAAVAGGEGGDSEGGSGGQEQQALVCETLREYVRQSAPLVE